VEISLHIYPISVLHARTSLIREHLQDKNISYQISEEFFVNLLADISTIIHGPYPRPTPSNSYVLAALSDLKRFLVQIQEYKPPIESPINEQIPTVINVFHTNRTVNPKITINRTVKI
jgi:hypothetical protein